MTRRIPFDRDAERTVVAIALTTLGEGYDSASVTLRPESFHDPVVSRCWASIGKQRTRNEVPTIWTLEHDLKGVVASEDILSLDNIACDPAALPRFVRIVAEMAQRRALIAACRAAEAMAMDVENDHAAGVKAAERLIYKALATTQAHEAYKPMRETVAEVMAENAQSACEKGQVFGITTGIESLDYVLKGFRTGELIVIGGRTSEGKSSLALTIARHNAMPVRNKRTAYFSCEMTRADLVKRLVAGEGVCIDDQESWDYYQRPHSAKEIKAAYEAVGAMPIEVVYQPSITFAQVRTYLRRFALDGPIHIIVLDYLGIMGTDEKAERRDLDVSNFIQESLNLGAEFSCPVIAVQGLNRKSAHDGKLMRPQLSHLMDASAIEYGAHKVLLVHNPNAKLDADDDDDTGERDVIVAKNRRGKRNRTVKTRFVAKKFLFADEHQGAPAPVRSRREF